jgi:hypothetical protein
MPEASVDKVVTPIIPIPIPLSEYEMIAVMLLIHYRHRLPQETRAMENQSPIPFVKLEHFHVILATSNIPK